MHAVVLGVNGGAGRAIASEFASSGATVTGTGRDRRRFPTSLAAAGVRFVASDRTDAAELAAVLRTGADVVVDCLCFTAEHARSLLRHRRDVASVVMLSSRAVYVDRHGRHINSAEPPAFAGPVPETNPVVAPDFSGDYRSGAGYSANKVAAERVLLGSGCPVSVLRPGLIHGPGAGQPREWFVLRRLLAGERRIPLAHAGRTADHTTAAANLARLVVSCARRPAARVLNAGDPDPPTAAGVVVAIAAAAQRPVEVVAVPDGAAPPVGRSPWSSWPPFLLDTTASAAVGYPPAGTYAQTVPATIEWLLALSPAQQNELDAAG